MCKCKSFTFKDGRVLEIHVDPEPESPRRWDNLCDMVCYHTNYDLGDPVADHGIKREEYTDWDDMQAGIEQKYPGCVILPIYMYEHSGITISTTPFSCKWDSGQIGFIFLRADFIKNYCDNDRKRALHLLNSEVEEYDIYLRGEVYGFILYDAPCKHCGGKGEQLDSCGGFHGSNLMTNGVWDHLLPDDQEELVEMIKSKKD